MVGISRAQKVRLGIFVATGMAILIGALLFLVGRTLIEQRDEYLIRFSDKAVSLGGMEIGSEVKYGGLRIGRVEMIRLAEGDVSTLEVVISVPQKTPIAEDSIAQVAAAGITGLKYVELSRGSSQARLRKPGEVIPSGASLMDELSSKAIGISTQLQEILANLKTMTGPDSSVQGLLKSSQTILEENRGNIAGIIQDTHKVTTDLANISQEGAGVVLQAQTFMTSLNKSGNELNKVLSPQGSFIKSINETELLLQRVNLMVLRSENDLDVTLRNLREASANLADFSMAIRDNPTLLLNNPANRGAPEGP